MNDIIDIEIILKKQKYSSIYNIGTIILIILLILIYISFTYEYKSYYISKGIMVDNKIKLLVNIEDIKYVINNDNLTIDNITYKYDTYNIDEEIYVDDNLNNYKYVYLDVDNLRNINNYVYYVKLLKEKKKIIEYIKEYI